MGLLLLAAAVIGAAAGWALHAATAGRRDTTAALARLGLTRNTARLYRQAIALLAGLAVTTDIDRVNILHPADRQRIERLLAEHDKEISTR